MSQTTLPFSNTGFETHGNDHEEFPLLGPAVGRQPITFILPKCVSYLRERGVLCVGNGWGP